MLEKFKSKMENDPFVRKIIEPVRIVQETPNSHNESELLLSPNCRQANVCVPKTFKFGGSILLDFGFELYGSIKIISGINTPNREAKLKIRFGESASEALQDGEYGHTIQNCIMKLPSSGTLESGLCGFRFVYIELLDKDIQVELKAVKALLQIRDIPYLGSFDCSDSLLNEIWTTGAYTVHLNMQEYLWDGIKRDRLVWAGDVHPAVMVINAVFGNVEVVADTLNYLRETTPLPGFMNDYCAYSLWWLISVRDWYLYQGNLSFLNEQADYIADLLYYMGEHVSDGGIEKLKNNRFLDWNTAGDAPAIHAGLQALMVYAFQASKELMEVLGKSSHADYADRMAKKMSLYIAQSDNKQAVALQVLSGQIDALKAESQVLRFAPLEKLSTFYGYYVLKARAEAGELKASLDMIRKFWGGMLSLGATSFWESFDMSWLENASRIDELDPDKIDVHKEYGQYCYKSYRHSLCHAWAAGPTAWLSEYILGVRPSKSGCKEILISPPPLKELDLEYVNGTFPSPKGIINIKHELVDDEVKTKVIAPSGINVVILEEANIVYA